MRLVVLVLALMLPTLAMAASGFGGTWPAAGTIAPSISAGP